MRALISCADAMFEVSYPHQTEDSCCEGGVETSSQPGPRWDDSSKG